MSGICGVIGLPFTAIGNEFLSGMHTVIFASEIKAILAHRVSTPRWIPRACPYILPVATFQVPAPCSKTFTNCCRASVCRSSVMAA
jgi:hypothetical protein